MTGTRVRSDCTQGMQGSTYRELQNASNEALLLGSNHRWNIYEEKHTLASEIEEKGHHGWERHLVCFWAAGGHQGCVLLWLFPRGPKYWRLRAMPLPRGLASRASVGCCRCSFAQEKAPGRQNCGTSPSACFLFSTGSAFYQHPALSLSESTCYWDMRGPRPLSSNRSPGGARV